MFEDIIIWGKEAIKETRRKTGAVSEKQTVRASQTKTRRRRQRGWRKCIEHRIDSRCKDSGVSERLTAVLNPNQFSLCYESHFGKNSLHREPDIVLSGLFQLSTHQMDATESTVIIKVMLSLYSGCKSSIEMCCRLFRKQVPIYKWCVIIFSWF